MPALFVEDAFFLPLYTFSSFVENQVFIGLWVNIQVFHWIPLVVFSVFMPVPSRFVYFVDFFEEPTLCLIDTSYFLFLFC